MKKSLIMTLVLTLWIGMLGVNVSATLNTEDTEDATVYINGKAKSSISARYISGDAYICMQDFFEYLGFETDSDKIRVTLTDEKDHTRTYSLGYFSGYGNKFYCYDRNIELCKEYFDLNPAYFSTGYNGDKEYEFELSKPKVTVDREHLYIYYEDLQNILNFNLITAPEINAVAIYRNKKVANSVTLYSIKGVPIEVCSIFKDQYIALGYKENLEDVLIMPESAVVSSDGINVSLNGGLLEFDVAPATINNRTMVPLRAIFEALNATVDWNEKTQTVTAKKGDTTITLTVGSDQMTVDSKQITLDAPSTSIDGRTLVPVRAVSEAFGLHVDWDENNALVILRETKYTDAETTLLYNLSGQIVEVPDYDIETFQANGWLTEKPVTMYALDGRTQYVLPNDVAANQKVGWYTQPVTIMYAADGRTTVVAQNAVEANKAVGWYEYPVTTLYAIDGRTIVIASSEVSDYQTVGWYTASQYYVTMYAPDGRTQSVARNAIEANKAVGWYEYPVTTLYAADGRTIVVASAEVSNYQSVGWYTASQYSIMQYAYLAGNDFRSIRRNYPHAVANGAYLYPYTDSNGDNCIMIYISYTIQSNWNAYYLHNLSTGRQIENPDKYYKSRINDYYGSDKLHYMDLLTDTLSAQANALKGFLGQINTGYFVDAATLNR